jgi:hypothetical protein
MEFVAINSKDAGLIDDRVSFDFGEAPFYGRMDPTLLFPRRAGPIHSQFVANYVDPRDPMFSMKFLTLSGSRCVETMLRCKTKQ